MQLDYLLYVNRPLQHHLRAVMGASVDNRNRHHQAQHRPGNPEGEGGKRIRRHLTEAKEAVLGGLILPELPTVPTAQERRRDLSKTGLDEHGRNALAQAPHVEDVRST